MLQDKMNMNNKSFGIGRAEIDVKLNSISYNTKINVDRCIIELINGEGWQHVVCVK